MKISESPADFHVPATLGLSSGAGEFGAGAADKRTTSCAVPSVIAAEGRPVRRVRGADFGGVVAGGVPAGVEGVPVVVLGVLWPDVVVVESADVVCVAAPETASAALVCATLAPASVINVQATVMNLVLVTGNEE
ncbi:MAG: hypothetical protein WAU42_00465 [Solirubrobacteraceae bacterium]